MKGLFPESTLHSKAPISLRPRCGACGLYKSCNSPKMPVAGEGRKRILILGEAPGKTEDVNGTPFIGESGQLLRETLHKCGISLRGDCWVTNALICHPKDNRTPTDKEIDHCLPNLRNTIRDLEPAVVVPLGNSATKAVMKIANPSAEGSISRWAGFQIPFVGNYWICPTYHPSFIIRMEYQKKTLPRLIWREHLEAMGNLDDVPYPDGPPDLRNGLELITDDTKAAQILDKFTHRGGPISFDYETNMLKPDSEDSQIISCAVCWKGERTIAFPWRGKVLPAMKRLLRSSCPKLGANIKFETRWTKRHLGCPVKNWYWDCNLGAHLADNRRGITSVKFQSFVLFGEPAYNTHIEPHFKSAEGSNSPNGINQIDIQDLLEYNGLDAILEFKIAYHQMIQTEYPLP